MEIPHIPNLIYYAIHFFIVTVIFESVVLYKNKPKSYNIKDTFASLSMGIGHKSRFFLGIAYCTSFFTKNNLSTALRQTWTGGFFSFISLCLY